MTRFLPVFAALACSGCAPDSFRDVPLEACAEVEASGALTLRLVDAESAFLRLRGTAETIAAAIVEVDGGTVRIEGVDVAVDASCPQLRAFQLLGSVAADLGQTMPPLERLAVYGDSTVAGAGVSAPDLDVRVSGQGAVNLAQLDVGNLQVLTGGESQAVLDGSASVFKLDATGRARVDAGTLRAQTVVLDASSSSVVTIWATAHLDAIARDNASVVYAGAPDLNVQTEDSASITGDSTQQQLANPG